MPQAARCAAATEPTRPQWDAFTDLIAFDANGLNLPSAGAGISMLALSDSKTIKHAFGTVSPTETATSMTSTSLHRQYPAQPRHRS